MGLMFVKVRSGYPSAICVARPGFPAILPAHVSGYPVLFVHLFIRELLMDAAHSLVLSESACGTGAVN